MECFFLSFFLLLFSFSRINFSSACWGTCFIKALGVIHQDVQHYEPSFIYDGQSMMAYFILHKLQNNRDSPTGQYLSQNRQEFKQDVQFKFRDLFQQGTTERSTVKALGWINPKKVLGVKDRSKVLTMYCILALNCVLALDTKNISLLAISKKDKPFHRSCSIPSFLIGKHKQQSRSTIHYGL